MKKEDFLTRRTFDLRSRVRMKSALHDGLEGLVGEKKAAILEWV